MRRTIMSATITLKEYLSKKKTFVVPEYQRGYVWGKARKIGEKDSVTYILDDIINLKTSVDFIAEAQRCRVTQRKSEVLWGNGKYKNFSDGVNLHQLGVACMVLHK
jgi:hypothetical protein